MTPDEAREAVVTLPDRYHNVRPILAHILDRIDAVEGAEAPGADEVCAIFRNITEQKDLEMAAYQRGFEKGQTEVERLTASLARAEAAEVERTREGQAWKARAERAAAERERMRHHLWRAIDARIDEDWLKEAMDIVGDAP